jgi:hypothetical protein
MMVMRRRFLVGVILAAALVPTLLWLRDPPWLGRIESGLGPWSTDESGTRSRWTAGRASFFVPAEASEVRLPLRPGRDTAEWPVVVTVSVDDRLADRMTLTQDEWYVSRVRLPPPGSRRFRRIDIHADRTVDGTYGVQLGEVQVAR